MDLQPIRPIDNDILPLDSTMLFAEGAGLDRVLRPAAGLHVKWHVWKHVSGHPAPWPKMSADDMGDETTMEAL